MHRRYRRHVRIEQVGEPKVTARGRVVLILSVPALSLLLPALAVVVADTGGHSAPVRISADVERFLLFYSGVFALVALTAAVGAGVLATDRIVMTAERRIMAQGLHRMMSLVGVSALANHIMLEILAHRVTVIDGFVPFMAARRTFFMGLGTLASDLFIVIIVTGILRSRFTTTASRRWMWRALHATSYAAWPLAILHGLLAGRSAKPYVDWSYGACLAAVGLALTMRLVLQARGRNGADGTPMRRPQSPLPAQSAIPPTFAALSGPQADFRGPRAALSGPHARRSAPYARLSAPQSRMSGPQSRPPGPPSAPDMLPPGRRATPAPQQPPRPPQRRQLPALPAGASAPVPAPRSSRAPNWPLPDSDTDPAGWPSDGWDD